MPAFRTLTLLVAIAILAACGGTGQESGPSAAESGTPTTDTESPFPSAAGPDGTAVLVGAGDIGDCNSAHDEATGVLLDGIAGTVFTAGDNAYDDGTAKQFAECYDPAWGRHRARTYPAAGNHDYRSTGAQPYFDYFGQRAGEVGVGYYSYDLGSWHIIVLNSNCGGIGGCEIGSPQEQ